MRNLIILGVLGLLLVAGTLFFALRYFDGPPVETHYKRGLSYDRNKQSIKKLGLKLNIGGVSKNKNNTDNDISLRFTLDHGREVSIDKIKPSIRRPVSGESITPHLSSFSPHHSPFRVHLTFKSEERGFFLLDVAVMIKGSDEPLYLQKSFYIK